MIVLIEWNYVVEVEFLSLGICNNNPSLWVLVKIVIVVQLAVGFSQTAKQMCEIIEETQNHI